MGVLALELGEGQLPAVTLLERAVADRVAAAMSRQLGRWLPTGQEYGLTLAAALYDPAELLRPSFPLHRELAHLFAAGQREGLTPGQVLTLSANAGKMPSTALQPDPSLRGGALLVLPVVLLGSETAIASAGESLEEALYDQGLADAAIVIELAAALGVSFEHVRWMSLLDLAAMTAAQLEHVGFGPAWQLIEESLYGDPPQALSLRTAQGQSLQFEDGAVWLEFLPYSLYARISSEDDPLAGYVERTHQFRQLQALFSAHGLPARIRLRGSELEHACSRQSDDFVVESLSESGADPARWILHEHPGLGALAFTAVAADGEALAHHYPLSAAAIARLHSALRGSASAIERPGRVCLSADGLDLAIPGAPDGVSH